MGETLGLIGLFLNVAAMIFGGGAMYAKVGRLKEDVGELKNEVRALLTQQADIAVLRAASTERDRRIGELERWRQQEVERSARRE